MAFCPPPPHAEAPDTSHWVATASDDGTARVWEAPLGTCLFILKVRWPRVARPLCFTSECTFPHVRLSLTHKESMLCTSDGISSERQVSWWVKLWMSSTVMR